MLLILIPVGKKPRKNHKHVSEGNSSKDATLEVDDCHRVFKANNALFENKISCDNIRNLFLFVTKSHLPVNVLLIGPQGSPKTLFLMACMKIQQSYFTLESHGTEVGVWIMDYLFKNGPRNLIIDEIEYVPLIDQIAL